MNGQEQEIAIRQTGVPYGFVDRRIVPGYVLADGTVLLESERNETGRYKGGAGMDGVYLPNGQFYSPVLDAEGNVRAFREAAPEGCPAGTGQNICASDSEATPSIRGDLLRYQEETDQAPPPEDATQHERGR